MYVHWMYTPTFFCTGYFYFSILLFHVAIFLLQYFSVRVWVHTTDKLKSNFLGCVCHHLRGSDPMGVK